MSKSIQATKINNDVTLVIRADKLSRQVMATLSRDLMPYVYATNDIGELNRLIAGLTPANQKLAVKYFNEFVGWSFDKDSMAFGKKSKAKAHKRKYAAMLEFLADKDNNIWSYKKDNAAPSKPKDYCDKFAALASKALADEKEGVSKQDLIKALVSSEVLTLKDLLVAVDGL
jgi:hypothetical protein